VISTRAAKSSKTSPVEDNSIFAYKLGIAGICRFAIDLDILDGLNEVGSEDIQEYSDEES
jgi:hypothetical protein